MRLLLWLTRNLKLAVTAIIIVVLTVVSVWWAPGGTEAQSSQNPQQGAIGIEGVVPSDPPTTGAVITFPANQQVFTELPIRVSGICPAGLLVKIFKNEVFGGSVVCSDAGTFELSMDLFSGSNEIVARVFDALDQPGPDSNTVVVQYDSGSDISQAFERLVITSNFAKRGANPGETLRWPMQINGGLPPYAVSVDWGDGEESLISLPTAGEFEIEHVYELPGTYTVVVRASDANSTVAYFQVVAVSNGAIAEQTNATENTPPTRFITRFELWPLYVMFILIISTFWLGKRYEHRRLKKQMEVTHYP